MTRRQAAPPAQRWLLVIVALLAGPWLGQGSAYAESMSVNPQSGPVGTHVQVTLSGFGDRCAVFFDGEAVAGVNGGCEGNPLVFDVPQSATVGEHQVHAVGGEPGIGLVERTMTFTVRPTPVTTPPVSSAPVTVAAADINVGEVGAPATTVCPSPVTTAAGVATPSPTTTAAGRADDHVHRRPAHIGGQGRSGRFRGWVQARRGGPHALRGGPHRRPTGGRGVRVDVVGVGGYVQ